MRKPQRFIGFAEFENISLQIKEAQGQKLTKLT